MSKGPDAFRTISEVAAELNLPQHVLRFWETRFGQIKPLKRGGGRRYYRPDDVELLRGIRQLLYGEGYTIRGVQRILKEQGPRFAISAGRGEVSGMALPRHVDDEGEGDVDAAVLHAVNGDDDDDAPTLDTREFRSFEPPPQSNGGGHVRAAAARLSDDEQRRLQTTLTELLELKRLLDQSR